jgi:LacI family transcriptional regulator
LTHLRITGKLTDNFLFVSGFMKSAVTIADIAQAAGVSKMTVSKVLNQQPGISLKTQKRVLQIAQRLNYTPHHAARKLAGGKTNIIGVVVPSLESAFVSEVVHGVGQALEQASKDLLLFTDHPNNQRDRLFFLTRGLVDGLLVVLPRDLERYNHAQLRDHLPVVVVEPITQQGSFPQVSAENYLSTRKAIEHLIELGHRRIGMIKGVETVKSSHIRLQAYCDALKAAGIAPNEELIRPGNFNQKRGFEAALELLTLPNPPSAVFAANDLSAFGVYDAIKHRGLRIPQDISVVGFDDIFQASQVYPPLTTIHQPASEMGAAGTRLLLSLVQGLEPVMHQIELPTELIVRASTAPQEVKKR